MHIGVNCTVGEQCRLLEEIIRKNEPVFHVVSTLPQFDLKNAYVAAGCVTQTVWNYQSGNDINYGINDIDIIYFDSSDLSYEAEAKVIEKVGRLYSGIGCGVDIKNEARVHLWYKDKFGTDIPPYKSSEDAINSWLSATAVGINYNNGKFDVYAPYGLNDLFGKTIRPNKSFINKRYFTEKSNKWKSKWNDIVVIDW